MIEGENKLTMDGDANICLKYYRDKRSSRFEAAHISKNFNGGYNCVLIVRVQNCECTVQKVDAEKSKRVPG